MTVLGFRSDPSTPRYALVRKDASAVVFANADGETRLVYPANVASVAEKAVWLYREVERIFRDTPGISHAVIKTNEYTQSDSKAKRESSYAEAMLLLYCAQHQIPVEVKTYGSLGTNSGSVKEHAEVRVGRSSKYWDGKMADAVVAAWSRAHSL